MPIGTGIFLASLVIGLVMLYGQTKDRWNWLKIWKRVAIAIGIIIFIIATVTSLSNTNWEAFEYDWSTENILAYISSIIMAGYLVKFWFWIFDKVFDSDGTGSWRFSDPDKRYTSSNAYKNMRIGMIVIFLSVVIYLPEHLKPIIATMLKGA